MSKTKTICHNETTLCYPVSTNITDNLPRIKTMVKTLLDIWGMKNRIKNKGLNIICRGSSGAIVATIFATELIGYKSIRIAHVKKEGEKSHSDGDSLISCGVNIIVDDLIDSGKTINAINEWFEGKTKYYGTEGNKVIDAVIITGSSNLHKLNFEPKYHICSWE